MDYNDYKITDFNYILSSIGNAYFSGLSLQELWTCIEHVATREELDIAVSTSIKMKEILCLQQSS
jgi:hypothetical protein